MSLQEDFSAALEQIAAGKREQAAAALATKAAEQAKADTGAAWFRSRFELLDADGQPAEPLPTTDPAEHDFNNFFGLKD